MSELAVITPTWRPDAHLFADLHRSVLEFTPPDTVHHVIVPAAHRRIFARYASRRCRIWTHPELLPRRYIRLPPGIWVNTRQPWLPVRGWIMQQAAKIAAAATVPADIVLIADSDSVLVRPVCANRLRANGRISLYRLKHAIDGGMERHVLWHQVARDLLGLPSASPPPLHDYVNGIGVWDPAVVRAMQRRISEVTGQHWADALTGRLHVSEFITYGVFVDEVLRCPPPAESDICHACYRDGALSLTEALEFADSLKPAAIGMMISGKTNTPRDIRWAAIRRCAEIVARVGVWSFAASGV